jgi:protein-disulfide isomerase
MKTTLGAPTEPTNVNQNMVRMRLLISAAVFVLVIIAALIVVWRFNFKSSVGANPAPMDASPALGPNNAPVTIIEYSDFGCPACVYWYKLGVLTQLQTKYGDQIGFVWRDYPVITLLSPRAAEARQCANEQGKFWEFHDAVYSHDGSIQPSELEVYAAGIGLNTSQFNECMGSRRYRDRVNAEMQEAFGYGYNGAPFFIVNNRVIIHGMQLLPVFSSVIDPILAAKK